ncbi:MAG: putative transcription antitermination factor YqgF [Candidatus Paceibacteria bacterium]|jgi:putative transcription antitermination factor YqgF
MRLLGIDYGTKKVGLALTDESGSMAFPHAVIPNDGSFLQNITALIEEKLVTAVVIGQSLNLDGTPNAVQTNIESFITDLTLQTPVPIHLEPEQMTTQQAAATTGRNDQTDAAAAALILESYLAKQRNMSEPQEKTPEVIEEEISKEISFDQFMDVEIILGTIEAVEVVENADKLLKLTVNLGEENPRQIVSGIREFYEDEQELVGKQCPFIANLAPRKIKGLVSQGMILAGEVDGVFAILNPSNELPTGTRLY